MDMRVQFCFMGNGRRKERERERETAGKPQEWSSCYLKNGPSLCSLVLFSYHRFGYTWAGLVIGN